MKIPMKLILLKIFQVVLFLCTVPAWGADFIPAITNYTVKDYQGAHQNWACAQGDVFWKQQRTACVRWLLVGTS